MDLFAPPTKDELAQSNPKADLFAPPTKEELGPSADERGLLQDVDFPGKEWVRGGINALPIAGSIGGELLGSAAGTVALPIAGTVEGGLVGSMAGGAAGTAGKDYLNDKLFGEKKSLPERITGPVTSGLLSGLATGGGLNTIGKSALVGGAMGAAEPTHTDNPIKERLGNAAIGAGTAGLIHGGVGAVTSAATNLGPKVAQEAEDFYVRAIGARPKFFEQATDQKISDVAKYAKDSGMVKPGDSISDIADKAYDLKQNVGQQLGSLYKEAKEKAHEFLMNNTNKDIQDLLMQSQPTIDELKSEVLPQIEQSLKGTDATGPQKAVENYFNGLKNQYGEKPLDLEDLHLIKSNLQKEVDWSKSRSDMMNRDVGFATASRNVADKINNHMDVMDGVLEKSDDQSLAKELQSLNKDYGLASTASSLADKASGKARGLNRVGLTDAILGAGAMNSEQGVPGVVKGLAVGTLSKAARSYGNPITANILDKAGTVLNSWPAQKASQAMQILKDNSVPDQIKANLMNRMINGQ